MNFNSDSACLARLYWPKRQKRNFDEGIMAAIRYSGELMDIRNMLYFQLPLDDVWLDRISRDMVQPRELLEIFKGKTLDAFYREAICGGHVMVKRVQKTIQDYADKNEQAFIANSQFSWTIWG